MIQEDKQLLLVDLCSRLPYYCVKCQFEDTVRVTDGESDPFYDYVLSARHLDLFINHKNFYIKPYLRPMSSMTEEEKINYRAFFNYDGVEYPEEYIDWLNKNMFDYRGLIEKGLALKAPEGMYI